MREPLTLLEKLELAKTLWSKAMPPECPPPDDWEFLRWIDHYDPYVVEMGIVKSAKKMRLNLREGRELIPDAAARYSTSVMTHLRDAGLEKR
jgi:hypothetical protein